jgi:hypothetical protein
MSQSLPRFNCGCILTGNTRYGTCSLKEHEVYVKVVESTVGKRGSKSAISKDYNRCVFKGTVENSGDFISKALCILEYP